VNGVLELDGSYGEGGGQIVRTALSLSAITGRPVRIDNVRQRRTQPGLRPQHLAAVRAVARICGARVRGADIGSRAVEFVPGAAPAAGEYAFDVAEVSEGGSAGSTGLLFQCLFMPLALARGCSTLSLAGGTHVRWSPCHHYLAEVFLPAVRRLGLHAELDLVRWGWYPRGGGRVVARIQGLGGSGAPPLRPLLLMDRGRLVEVRGFSAASNLPEHVIRRQKDQVLRRLKARHLRADIDELTPPADGPGTALFVLAKYEHVRAGFTGYGRVRYPAEKVADDAADAFEEHLSGRAAVDPYLADQLLLPAALAPGTTEYGTSRVTGHLLTNAWVIRQFLDRRVTIAAAEGCPGVVRIE